jgi:hypothetical protein
MDRGRNIVVARTHTLSKALLFSYSTYTWTLRHTRIAVLGFVTHYLVQTPLQSESHVYISRLVKTRDPYPGLLQFAILFRFPLPFQSAFLHLDPSLLLSLSTLLSHHRLSGGAVTPFSLLGDLVLANLVSENANHVLQATSSSPSRTDG